MLIRYNTAFVIREGRLQMRVRWGKNEYCIRLGYSIDSDKWNAQTHTCIRNSTHGKNNTPAHVINNEIQFYNNTVDKIFNAYELKRTTPTKEEFKNDFTTCIGKTNKITNTFAFYEVYDKFINNQSVKNAWSVSTMQKFKTIKNHLIRYDKNASFDKINEEWLNGFMQSFTSRGYKNSTTTKDIKFLRWFLRWACNNGYYNGNCHETYKPRLKGSGDKEDIIYLTWEELQQLYNYQYEEPALARVRDTFCFCCFSGLRYSDVAKLQKTDVYDNKIHIVTRKTADSLSIDLNDYTRELLEKYKNTELKNGLALPIISNQKMNATLKDVARIAGINTEYKSVFYIGNNRHENIQPKWQLVTTHTGRHTFIVNALTLGIPLEVIMRFTGHAKYESVKPYLKIVDNIKTSEMQKFNKK